MGFYDLLSLADGLSAEELNAKEVPCGMLTVGAYMDDNRTRTASCGACTSLRCSQSRSLRQQLVYLACSTPQERGTY